MDNGAPLLQTLAESFFQSLGVLLPRVLFYNPAPRGHTQPTRELGLIDEPQDRGLQRSGIALLVQ